MMFPSSVLRLLAFACLCAVLLVPSSSAENAPSTPDAQHRAAQFQLSDVQITDPAIHAAFERNTQYLLSLDVDRLLFSFRKTANLPTSPSTSSTSETSETSSTSETVQPYGGWEAPDCGLRGHFVGHYLSACSKAYGAERDPQLKSRLKERVETIVSELGKCQNALGTGYLSAFPTSQFDKIETEFTGAWAPYYTIHKILYGLLDAARYTENQQALEIAKKLADYLGERLNRLSPDAIEKMLYTPIGNPTNESGGMSDVLHLLARLTNDEKYAEMAHIFDREWFLGPLSKGEDQLTGLHCNTHIPLVLGACRHFECTGDPAYKHAAEFFWTQTALKRSYANGGSSGPRPDGVYGSKGAEHWAQENCIAGSLTNKNCESCVTHNMLRLTSVLMMWNPSDTLGDFYERAYWNSVLTMQHPTELGRYIYHHPLISNSKKEYGTPENTFWCCYGTSVEAFASLASDIYYKLEESEKSKESENSGISEKSALYVNLFVPSVLTWDGLQLEQNVTDTNTEKIVTFTFQQASKTDEPQEKSDVSCDRTLRIRRPAWVSGKISAEMNEETVSVTDGPLMFRRNWKNGDTLTIHFPMKLRAEAAPDDPQTAALFFGPRLMAVRSTEPLVFYGTADELAEQAPKLFRLVPITDIADEPFGVYIQLKTPSESK